LIRTILSAPFLIVGLTLYLGGAGLGAVFVKIGVWVQGPERAEEK